MAILTRAGRAAIVESLMLQPIHLAWGTGDIAWGDDPPPAESVEATGLIQEVGRRVASDVGFAEPDDNGDIVVPTGRFARVETPTNHLYLKFQYDFEDGSEHVIRELGVFVGTQFIEDLPPGQRYFLPEHIANPGTLLVFENTLPNHRSVATRETYEFVTTF
uniref:Uncharacterized protein n=1 Tax=Candidatus Kentrum sp. LFY TaxID=2126342 RepID=A0A450W6T1_9GAMM|nr:MAG: hypothetical protein BECKLFY1418C_GA0070996_100176 [Candidatus Kentron sp. LFY]